MLSEIHRLYLLHTQDRGQALVQHFQWKLRGCFQATPRSSPAVLGQERMYSMSAGCWQPLPLHPCQTPIATHVHRLTVGNQIYGYSPSIEQPQHLGSLL